MSGRERCDEILRLIDQALGDETHDGGAGSVALARRRAIAGAGGDDVDA